MPISLLILMMLVPNSAHAFTLATWNVAEFADADALRLTRLIEAVITDLPEVIFLQEAESVTLRQLRKLPRLSAEYAVLQGTDRGGLPPGGIVILVKKSLKPWRTSYRQLPSEMDRGALSITIDLCGYPHRLWLPLRCRRYRTIPGDSVHGASGYQFLDGTEPLENTQIRLEGLRLHMEIA